MRFFKPTSVVFAFGLTSALLLVATTTHVAAPRDLGRETLAADDGWASFGSGTTGGEAASSAQTYVVTTRRELLAALNNGVYPPPSTPSAVPKIIYVSGVIDLNVDDNNQPLGCTDYYRNGYTLEAFLAAYDPAVWGKNAPSGPLETARVASQAAQQARVRVRVGSNTTIVGLNAEATIKGGWFDIRGSSTKNTTNIIIRNLRFVDTYDCFPEWTPTDGANGAWNALYDAISLRNADHVWVDHNEFADIQTADWTTPDRFGVHFEMHDGQVDITNASDYVTVSWNRFRDHDKVMLIGSSDSASADEGKLKVTIHHNVFEDVGQRAPRVRYGQVHVYNNLYRIKGDMHYNYSWGVGFKSAIYAENNLFRVEQGIGPADFIEVLKGTRLYEEGTLVNAASANHLVDVVRSYNEVNDPDLSYDAGWAPTLFLPIDQTFKVQPLTSSRSGPFDWLGDAGE